MMVVVIAESASAAETVRRTLRYAPSCRVAGFLDSGHPCGDAIGRTAPDVVIFDDPVDDDVLLGRVREARAAAPGAKLVLLARHMDAGRLDAAAEAGIDAAVGKTASPASVGTLVREIAAGNVYHAFARCERTRSAPPAFVRLTGREQEILLLVAEGMSNAHIAAELWVTEQTVKFHLSNVFRKLNVANRTEASHFAHLHGILRSTEPASTKTRVAA